MKILSAKNIVVTAAIAAAGAMTWLLIRRKKKAVDGETKSILEPNYTNTEFRQAPGIVWPLKYGSGSNPAEKTAVKRLQAWLNERIHTPRQTLKLDGIFGVLTQAALVEVTGKTTMSKEEFSKLSPITTATRIPKVY